MNTASILRDVEHRPYPLPEGPWVTTQSWHELLFAHWPIAPGELRALVPESLALDTFEEQSWVGVVPFRVSNARPRWSPLIPGLSQFLEINVRTYVVVNGIPGVYFFSLDAANALAVALARTFFHLPYYRAQIQCQEEGDTIHYHSQRTHPGARPGEFAATYEPIAPVVCAGKGTLEYWLTERYCLYALAKQRRLYRLDIHHKCWPLQIAESELQRNTMALGHGITLPDTPPLLHYAKRQDVLLWPLHRVR
ncbi:MAG: DUF2071 domain-containing protein [Chloroflexota bacterium]|nr:DUF2071 domain-containing protein [Chloroflexota bacterium]